MRNLFAFIRRFSVLLFFLLLETISMVLLVRYNKFHQAAYMDTAGEITGAVEAQYKKVNGYFFLKRENEELRRRLTEVQNKLAENFQAADTSKHIVTDTVSYDTTGNKRKYLYMDAEVVNNSISLLNNYFTIHRGTKQGVEPGMVVLSANGVAGVVMDVTENFATVMSMLNKQKSISAKLLKTGETGKIEWDGANPRLVQLHDIPKSVKVQKGDTVVTSQYSDFPPGIMIGIIEKVVQEQSSNNYLLHVRPANDFSRLQNVFVVANFQRAEQKELEDRLKKKK
ncbi:MAG: rod shape-determining protein MreC [Lacibacter sp.]